MLIPHCDRISLAMPSLLRRGFVLLLAPAFVLSATSAEVDPSYRKAAFDAARWIRANGIRDQKGLVWPADPRDEKSVGNTLYSGNPGVVLFLLELTHSAKDGAALSEALFGSDVLLASVDTEKDTGLYTGLAGIGFALGEAGRITRTKDFSDGARKVVKRLGELAVHKGRGIQWNDTTDIISGSAGTGLFLLYAARELKDPAALALAAQAGRRLIELAQPENGGLKWAMDPAFPRLMPNFSHGTAGVAYFLASLYQATKQKEFLAAALAGARYLLSIAETEGNVCLIMHNDKEGAKLHYLSWCHGPAGTARLFYRLHEITGEKQWLDWVHKSARAILQSGIPEKQTPGFWNNVGQCCGTAGAAEFMLSLYRVTGKREYLDFARRATKQILAAATRDKETDGLKWIHAEHRVRPADTAAQTGYMQGAAGIGMWLLRLDDFDRGITPAITFPDSPF